MSLLSQPQEALSALPLYPISQTVNPVRRYLPLRPLSAGCREGQAVSGSRSGLAAAACNKHPASSSTFFWPLPGPAHLLIPKGAGRPARPTRQFLPMSCWGMVMVFSASLFRQWKESHFVSPASNAGGSVPGFRWFCPERGYGLRAFYGKACRILQCGDYKFTTNPQKIPKILGIFLLIK